MLSSVDLRVLTLAEIDKALDLWQPIDTECKKEGSQRIPKIYASFVSKRQANTLSYFNYKQGC